MVTGLTFLLLCTLAARVWAEEHALGASIRGYGGLVSADSPLGAALGTDEPDPLRGHDLRAAGVRGAGGFGVELFYAYRDLRFGFDTTVFFSDAYRLSSTPLANGFSATAHSATTGDFDVFFGRMFAIGDIKPYVDLRLGISLLDTPVRLENPAFGFVGETRYDAVRFMFGPRAGVYIPITPGLSIDTGAETSLLGYSRIVGFAGVGVKLGTDDRLSFAPPDRR